ncbi:MAG: GmrSD restriction endonuclease domain-containing protein, partial [Paraclostridium sp.]
TFDFKNKFHVDHIHAKSIFTNKKLKTLGVDEIDVDFYKDTVNNLANLQLLEGQVNIEKNDKEFDKWIDETFNDDTLKNEYIKKHYIPNVSLNITNFKEFIEKRNNIIKIELLTNLK